MIAIGTLLNEYCVWCLSYSLVSHSLKLESFTAINVLSLFSHAGGICWNFNAIFTCNNTARRIAVRKYGFFVFLGKKKWKHNTNFIRNLLKENATANCVEALSGNGKKCGAVLWEKIMSREVTYFICVSWKECIWSGYWVFGARQIHSEMCIKTSSNQVWWAAKAFSIWIHIYFVSLSLPFRFDFSHFVKPIYQHEFEK